MALRIQKLIVPEEFAGEALPQELLAAAGGAMQNQNGVAYAALMIAPRLAEPTVMETQLRQNLAAMKGEVADDKVAMLNVHRVDCPVLPLYLP